MAGYDPEINFESTNKKPRNDQNTNRSPNAPFNNPDFSQSFNGKTWRNDTGPRPLFSASDFHFRSTERPNTSHLALEPPQNGDRNPFRLPPKSSNYLATTSGRSTQIQKPTKSKVVAPTNFKGRLDTAKKTSVCDVSEFTEMATIPNNPDWQSFLYPIRVLMAQRTCMVAAKALCLHQAEAKKPGAVSVLSEEEFRSQLAKVSEYNKPTQ